MPSFLDLLVVIGMAFLRFGVPALVIVAIGYGLKRLDARWEREAREYSAKQPQARKGVQPAAPVRKPQPQPQPFIPPAVRDSRIQPGVSMAVPSQAPIRVGSAQQACWDAKKCSPATKAECAAPQHPELPCWQARFEAEGAIPADCAQCDVFKRYPTH